MHISIKGILRKSKTREMIIFDIVSRLIKCLEINLNKEVKGVCNTNLKDWKKEIEEDTRR